MFSILSVAATHTRGLFDGVLVAAVGGLILGSVVGLIKAFCYVLRPKSPPSTPPPEVPGPSTSALDRSGSPQERSRTP
jgi:hypothetical protein